MDGTIIFLFLFPCSFARYRVRDCENDESGADVDKIKLGICAHGHWRVPILVRKLNLRGILSFDHKENIWNYFYRSTREADEVKVFG